MKNERIILAGGTGTMGRILQQQFIKQGHEVIVLTRRPEARQHRGVRVLAWDGRTAGAWTAELEGATAVINLAGRSVDCRYTTANKAEILNSRVHATRVLGEAIARSAKPPEVWINMSSATVYRHAEHSAMDEITGETGTDFSPQVVLAWEKEFFEHKRAEVRQLAVRCAMVFCKHGGAFPRFRQLTRMGLGGHHGSGKQFVSWVHEDDVASFFDWAIRTPSAQGIINLAAPHPVRELGLMNELRKRLKPIIAFNVPKWMLGVGAFVLRTEVELVLKSRRVVPTRAVQLGFAFQHTHIRTALDDLIGPLRTQTQDHVNALPSSAL